MYSPCTTSGESPIYAPIRDTETPVYVGKADLSPGAKTPKAQRTRLSDRLGDHRKNIEKVANLSMADFRCRRWTSPAAGRPLRKTPYLFKPI
ncbi:Eco29kI family restriction endonuclease [Nocardia brasiliensis]|uniref:Eco29kI family restriction endonuclease n=1 Tax=Nocardia brasiliensis TaxID=37326 RepID=UPI0037B50531